MSIYCDDDREPVECPLCFGEAFFDRCTDCGGEGFREYIDCPEAWGEDCPSEVNHLITCPTCGGGGGWLTCTACAKQATKANVPE